MKTNKERGYYWATYVCINCKTEMSVRVPYGQTMPKFDINANESLEIQEAPECNYCGCKYWSHGKKVD